MKRWHSKVLTDSDNDVKPDSIEKNEEMEVNSPLFYGAKKRASKRILVKRETAPTQAAAPERWENSVKKSGMARSTKPSVQVLTMTGDGNIDNDDDPASAYKRKRLENLRENARMLAELDISQAKNDLKLMTISEKPQRKAVRKRGEKQEPLSLPPRREPSARLQNKAPPDYTAVQYVESDSSELLLTYSKRLTGTIDIDINDEKFTDLQNSQLKSLLTSVSQEAPVTPEGSTDSVKCLQKMTLTSDGIKVVGSRTFSLAWHPSVSNLMVCAGDKWGKLGLWNIESSTGECSGSFLTQPHTSPITCTQFPTGQTDKVYTCSYDGTLRCGDLAAHKFVEVYVADDEDEGVMLTWFDFLSADGQTLVVSQTDWAIAIVDQRTNSMLAEDWYRVHNKRVKCVSVHPTQKQYICTAANDGCVCVWDLRKMSVKVQPVCRMQHSESVSSAYFSPTTGDRLLTTCLDNTIRLYDTSVIRSGEQAAQVVLRHNNKTGQYLTNLKATWHPRDESMFVVGCMKQPRRVELYDCNGALVHEYYEPFLLESVCSVNAFHPGAATLLAGANSSGRIHVWR